RHRADLAVMSNSDGPQDGGADADGDVVLDSGVAFHPPVVVVLPPASRAQCHLMVQHDVVADLGRLADDHAGAMIYEEAPPDLRARMDLDAAGEDPGDLRDQARQHRYVQTVESMCDSVEEDRMQALIG